jgi:hypothetical protein
MKVEITSPSPEAEKAVMAHLVRVLKDEPKGLTITEINEKESTFEIPQGPMLINRQWW